MPNVPNALLQQYVKLTEFLGQALGPDYEVALHDLTDKNRSIIAIANNHISGREIGAPLTTVALSILRDKSGRASLFPPAVPPPSAPRAWACATRTCLSRIFCPSM